MPFPGTEPLPPNGLDRPDIREIDTDLYQILVGPGHTFSFEGVTGKLPGQNAEGMLDPNTSEPGFLKIQCFATSIDNKELESTGGLTTGTLSEDAKNGRILPSRPLQFMQTVSPHGAKAAIEYYYSSPKKRDESFGEFAVAIAGAVIAVDDESLQAEDSRTSYAYAQLVEVDGEPTEAVIAVSIDRETQSLRTELTAVLDDPQRYLQLGMTPVARCVFGPQKTNKVGQITNHDTPWRIEGIHSQPPAESTQEPGRPQIRSVGLSILVSSKLVDARFNRYSDAGESGQHDHLRLLLEPDRASEA